MKENDISVMREAVTKAMNVEECAKILHAVEEDIKRFEGIISRRERQIQELRHIYESIKQRREFLSVTNTIEPDSWYESRSNPDSCCLIKSIVDNDICAWEFRLNQTTIRRSYRDILFLHPSNNQVIDMFNNGNDVVVESAIEATSCRFHNKDNNEKRNFLLNWVPSSRISITMKNPFILEVQGCLEEMCNQNNKRRLSTKNKDDNGKSNLSFVKYQGQWYLLLYAD